MARYLKNSLFVGSENSHRSESVQLSAGGASPNREATVEGINAIGERIAPLQPEWAI